MPRKSRKPKTPLAAWIKENRRRLGGERHPDQSPMKPVEIGDAIGVDAVTVRGWEAGRGISDDNLDALERLFDREAPQRDGSGSPDQADVASAIRAQTDVMREFIDELRFIRTERDAQQTELARLLGEVAATLDRLGTPAASADRPPVGSVR